MRKRQVSQRAMQVVWLQCLARGAVAMLVRKLCIRNHATFGSSLSARYSSNACPKALYSEPFAAGAVLNPDWNVAMLVRKLCIRNSNNACSLRRL